MARAATRLKCSRDCGGSGAEALSLSQASCTSAVGVSVTAASSRATAEASRRSSS